MSGLQPHHAADFEITTKEGADGFGLIFDNVEGAVFDPIAEWNCSAHPDTLSFRGGDLIADRVIRYQGRKRVRNADEIMAEIVASDLRSI